MSRLRLPAVYQVEYSRNLLFKVGGQLDRVVNTLVDRTRSRLDVPLLRMLLVPNSARAGVAAPTCHLGWRS
jgi:hypothetical protein